MRRILSLSLALLLLALPLWAGRDHDGANDNINFGSDAAIDAFAQRTLAFWFRWDTSTLQVLMVKSAGNTDIFGAMTHNAAPFSVRFGYDWSTTDGAWRGNTSVNNASFHFACVTYDNSATTNVPVMTVDGISQTITTITTPVGTASSDAANSLRTGETDGATADFDGILGWLNYDNTLWTAAQCNVARWWGTPGGGIEVYQPLTSGDLTNKGSAGSVADGTATGTTVVGMPVPVQRPGTVMLLGVGF